jgi:hypothetical protein
MKSMLMKSLSALVIALGLAMPLSAQVTLKRGAVVYCGSGSNTTAPAVIDEARVKAATREWQRIQSEGIDLDSAQGKQLVHQMNSKVLEAVRSVAQEESRDLVVGKDDIADKRGKDVTDLTDKVVSKLGS